MPRKKTGEKLGRPFIYTSDEEKPITVSLRIPRDLATRMKQYAYTHRQSVTDVLLDGLKWRLEEAEDPRWPSQNGVQHYGNTTMREDTPTRSTATSAPLAGIALSVAPVDISRQTTQPDLDYDRTKYTLGKLCPRGHEYQGTRKTLLRISNRHCLACDREKFHERKQTKRQTAPVA